MTKIRAFSTIDSREKVCYDISMKGIEMSKNKLGFTMAEVLITLGVIGVVAAMTIPNVIKHYQQQETVAKLKKVYNIFSNALQMSRLEHGDVETWEIGSLDNLQSSSDFADEYIIPYIKILKACKTNQTNECSYSATNRQNQNIDFSKSTRLFLNDGTVILLNIKRTSSLPKVVSIWFDINGKKSPNKYGKDVFVFAIALDATSDKFKPLGRLNASGQSQNESDIKNNCITKGNYCSAYIMRNSWKMPEDYPW